MKPIDTNFRDALQTKLAEKGFNIFEFVNLSKEDQLKYLDEKDIAQAFDSVSSNLSSKEMKKFQDTLKNSQNQINQNNKDGTKS